MVSNHMLLFMVMRSRLFIFLNFIFTLFHFTILYWFCHTLTWIHHGCIRAPILLCVYIHIYIYEEQNRWKRSWCWERLKAGGEGDDGEWDGWMASLTQWISVWANSGRWWRMWKPDMLQSVGLQRWSDWTTTTMIILIKVNFPISVFFPGNST